jgi:hypothetical protein
MDSHHATVEDEINNVSMGRPHVVLLGAGASRVAFPEGEHTGKLLPLMADFTKHVPIEDLLPSVKSGGNFELIYSELANDPSKVEVRVELESRIFKYFSEMRLPPWPTLYDHLILSLRPKDVIATFNWDPFLIQAISRNRPLKGRGPAFLFLHGNVLSAYCSKDDVHGMRGANCSRCGKAFGGVPLLYPIAQKDYESSQSISKSWEYLRKCLKAACIFTVFGYGAPDSDSSAVKLLKEAWGDVNDRSLEQTEIIDIRDRDSLVKTWEPFIHTHHYDVRSDFYKSWIAKHPRRSGEAYWSQYMEVKFISENPIPQDLGFEELWSWYEPLIAAEEKHARQVD